MRSGYPAPVRRPTSRRTLPSARVLPALLAALLAAVACAAPARAQHHDAPQAAAHRAAEAGAVSSATLRVQEARGALTVEYGPLTLPARAGHGDIRQPPTLQFALPASGWMRGYAVELVDRAGRRVPQRTLHHMNLIAKDRRDLFSHAMLRVAAAGSETAAITLPRVVGFAGERGDSIVMTLMFHNPTDTSYEGVTLRVRVPFTRGDSRIGAVTVHPLSVAIGPKYKPNVFDLPPGRSEHSWEGSPGADGRILGLSGHLHRYGVALRLEDRTAGKVLWEVRPARDATGEVTAMPVSRFVLTGGKAIRRDHVYRLTAVYDNPEGRTIPEGGMGVMGGVLVLSGGSRWPRIDRAHPDYVADVEALFGSAHGGHAGHGVAPGQGEAGSVRPPR
jgi:hypothetical protein